MSRSSDCEVSMGHDGRPHERDMEVLLRGRPDAAPDEFRATARVIGRLRSQATVVPQPDAELLRVFTEGVTAAPGEPHVASPSPRETTPTFREKGHVTMRNIITKAAGLSLATKLTIGTAVAAAAVGAGASGGLGGAGDVPAAEQARFGYEIAEDAVASGGVEGQEIAAGAREHGEAQRDGWQSETAGEVGAARAERASETGASAREADADDASETGQEAREARAANGQRGLGTAGGRTDRAPETVPQSGGDGRSHAEQRLSETPAQDAPAGPETGEQHRSDTAGGVPPQDGRAHGEGRAGDRLPEHAGRR